MTESPAIEKRVATLQAQAALRGITVEPLEGGRYMVSMGLLLREADDLDALAALLERMGVKA